MVMEAAAVAHPFLPTPSFVLQTGKGQQRQDPDHSNLNTLQKHMRVKKHGGGSGEGRRHTQTLIYTARHTGT